MKTLNPYLNFPGNTEEAFNYYRSIFGGEFVTLVRFRDFPENSMGVPDDQLDRIAHVGLAIGGDSMLMGTDIVEGWRPLNIGNNFYIVLEVDTAEEADRVFGRLVDGGEVEMALRQTEWAEKYGHCRDRFGVQWMVSYTGNVEFSHPAASGAAQSR